MISIIIPCYNDQHTLPRAVESALRQSYPSREIIVVDDGSDEPVSNSFGNDCVRVVRHSVNAGLPAALNTGIRVSRGDRFVILAADDELAHDYLQNVVRQDADIVSVDMLVGGRPVRSRSGTLEELIEHNYHSYAALVRKRVWVATGGFKEDMNPSWEDWEFFINAAKLGATRSHVSRPLHIYHRNPSGRDASAQGKEALLWGKLQGYHQDLYGIGRGVVAFVVPCYDHEEYVAEAVQSALNQIYPHVQVVVVDDGSPGDVPSALAELPDLSRVSLIRQDNQHLSAARNTGIRYALSKFGAEYIVPLDADDQVSHMFVEHCLGELDGQRYAYSDVHFIGDAYHNLPMEDYDCNTIIRKHQHPCTILMPSRMWQDVMARRGYGYDEGMKKGYEDWEFIIAGIESGWCGHRVPEELFFYRYHAGGSMRMDANKIKGELVAYIKKKHPWMKTKEGVDGMCRSCGGGGRYTRSAAGGQAMSAGVVFIPGIGEVASNEVLKVQYTGATTSTITKVGAGGQIYKYSADWDKQARGMGPVFTIFARDAHLFIGPYDLSRIQEKSAAPAAVTPAALAQRRTATQPEPRVEVIEVQPRKGDRPEVPVTAARKSVGRSAEPGAGKLDVLPSDMSVDEAMSATAAGTEFEPEDFTDVKGVGPAYHKKLVDAGFTVYEDLSEANPVEVSGVLGCSTSKAEQIINAAIELVKELESNA